MSFYYYAMTELRPGLLLIMPADWEAVPEGLTELRRCLAEDYGASLLLRMSTAPMRSPLPLYVGYWEPWARRSAGRNIPFLIQAAFYTLNWLELEDVG